MPDIIVPSHLLGEEPLLASMAHGIEKVGLHGLDTRLVPLEGHIANEDPLPIILAQCVKS